MDDDNFDLESLPSSITLSSTYTPKSAPESPIDSPIDSPISQTPPVQTPVQEDDEDEYISPKEKYIWSPVDDLWQKILLSDRFFVKDCAPDGNCQFRSLEEALKGDTSLKFSHKKLRRLIAEHILTISDLEFKEIIENYRIEKENGEFYGEWDPNVIKTKRQLSLEIKKPGFHFEGDHVTLSLLSKILQIDIIIFNQNSHNITKIENDNLKFVILNFIQSGNTGHYKTIGFKQDKRIFTLFNRNNLPDDIITLLDKNAFYKKHIEYIYNLYEPFTCNDLLSNLESLLGKLINSDKILICKLSAAFVHKTKPKGRKEPKRKSKSKSRKSKSKSKSKSPKSESKSRKSKSKSPKSKSKSKSTKSKSTKSKSKSTKSKSKSKSTKSKSKSRKSKSKSKSKSRKSKSKSRKSKSKSKSKSRKSKSKSKSKSTKSKSKSRKTKSKSKSTKSTSTKSKSKSKSKSKKTKRKSKSKSKKTKKSVKRKAKKAKKAVKRKSKPTKR